MRISKQTLLHLGAMIVVLIAGLSFISSWLDPFDDRPFDSKSWSTATSKDSRAAMARDVLDRVGGLSRTEVVELLGEPDSRLNGLEDAGGHDLRGREVFSYHIGCWSFHGMDAAFIYVHFDAEGMATDAEVTGY